MEEVLTWLLEAEDRLNHDDTELDADLETIKEQFHSHEASNIYFHDVLMLDCV